ncbi:MAG: cell division protein FtsQ/DivIB [Bacteroidaceae bacterium]|nr:cell division protein FtsQ/DivIB [Bacteroidaceae bacterium]
MIKKILSITAVLILTGYLVFSIFCMSESHEDTRLCKGVEVVLKDSSEISLVDSEMIHSLLSTEGFSLEGKPLSSVNTQTMEDMLSRYPLIESAQCYKTSGDKVRVVVYSKVPLLRVRSNGGDDYYVDSKGEILTHRMLSLHLPVATGYIDRRFASDDLRRVVMAIDRSDFWRAQVVQINVNKDRQIELVPRVGGHLLILGSAENVEDKLDRLYNFYKTGLSRIGWNKYSSVSVAYENQVVCKKR